MYKSELGKKIHDKTYWCNSGPLLHLSVLSYIGYSKKGKTRHKELFINNIINVIKKIIKIEILEEEDTINKNIMFLCNGEEQFIHIRIFVNIAFKRRGYIHFEILDNRLLHTNVYFVDSDEEQETGKYREEANILWRKMIDKLKGFCGTLGLESNVIDIFKIDNLIINRGDKKSYGIENVYWKT
jgi:hypothetical protein